MLRTKVLYFFAGMLVAAGVTLSGGFRSPAAAGSVSPAASAQPTPSVAVAAVRPESAPVNITIQPGADSESQILEAIYKKVNPSVVQVVNMAQNDRMPGLGAIAQGEGSGFVWDEQGHIVTNDHVVSGADKLQVVFADGTTLDAQLVGTDPNGDIAVIKVDPSLVDLVPVERGDMAQVQIGQMAVAIGNPFGLEGTMTRGIVSALGRSIPSQTNYSIPEAIQTDAAINPGNSGGPLLNDLGQVIGVNDQIQSTSGSSSGVGFAIPISIVERIVPSLIEKGTYDHPYLGLSGSTLTRAWTQALGLPENTKGVYVLSVDSSGPADRAGLLAGNRDTNIVLGISRRSVSYLQSGGDVVTAVDGQPVTKMEDILIYLEEQASPGQAVQLTVLRDGKQQTVTLTLAARPVQTGS